MMALVCCVIKHFFLGIEIRISKTFIKNDALTIILFNNQVPFQKVWIEVGETWIQKVRHYLMFVIKFWHFK